jgi:hypothetical protein
LTAARPTWLWLALVILAARALADPAAAASHLRVVATIPGPSGDWDYATADAARRRIYVAHGTVVLSLDLTHNRLNPDFAAGDGLHAVVVVPTLDLLATTNGGDSTVKLVKASNGVLVKSLPVDADPDAAAYDPATGLVVVVHGEQGTLTLVDPRRAAVVGRIVVGGQLEFGQPDGRGRFYVNVEDRGQVAVVDLRAGKVVARFAMPGCQIATGLAYVEGDRILSACRGRIYVLDASTGRVLTALRVSGLADAVIYDARRSLAYLPTFEGRLWVVGLKGAGDDRIVDSVPTAVGARTGAVDMVTGRIFLPTASYDPPTSQGALPAPKPGTFRILVVDR